MGLFSKGQSQLTPAQQKLIQLGGESQQYFRKKWLPVQQYFAQTVEGTAPGLSAMEQGRQAGTARAAGTEAQLGSLQRTSARGAGLGSGASLTGLGQTGTGTAAAAGIGQTAGELQAKQAYEQGLAKVLSLGLSDQGLGQQGLQSAAGAEGATQAQAIQQSLQEQQGIGQLAGLAGAFGRGVSPGQGGRVTGADVSGYGLSGQFGGSDDAAGLGSNLGPEGA